MFGFFKPLITAVISASLVGVKNIEWESF